MSRALLTATIFLLSTTTIIVHVSAAVQIPPTEAATTAEPSYDDVEGLFAHFQAKYGRTYVDEQERLQRFEAFQANVAHIQKLRAANPYAHFALTHKADAYRSEYPKRGVRGARSLTSPRQFKAYEPKIDLSDLPYSVDWRKRGALNPVRDQMICGSCWAFAITAATESMAFIKTGTLPRISEQMLVSCDPGADGCNGARALDEAIEAVVKREDGVMGSRDAYPYASGLSYNPPCDTSFVKRVATVKDAVSVADNEVAMAAYVAEHGPLVVGIDADGLSPHYQHGIITNIPSDRVDHAVVVVGYGNSTVTDSFGAGKEVPYWIVRNSWGPAWGEDGYFRLLRGVNMALIANFPTGIEVA